MQTEVGSIVIRSSFHEEEDGAGATAAPEVHDTTPMATYTDVNDEQENGDQQFTTPQMDAAAVVVNTTDGSAR